MTEIKMDSLNANPVNPNKNHFQLNYTTETTEKSIFEMRVKELFELSFRAIRETQATVSFELTRKRMQKSVIDMLDQMVPLDYLISVTLRYNTWENISENLTWKQALQKTWYAIKEEVL